MKNQINKLRFEFEENSNPYGHDVKLEFSLEPDVSLDKIFNLCKKFAITLGYTESSVDKVFGEDCDD